MDEEFLEKLFSYNRHYLFAYIRLFVYEANFLFHVRFFSFIKNLLFQESERQFKQKHTRQGRKLSDVLAEIWSDDVQKIQIFNKHEISFSQKFVTRF